MGMCHETDKGALTPSKLTVLERMCAGMLPEDGVKFLMENTNYPEITCRLWQQNIYEGEIERILKRVNKSVSTLQSFRDL